MVLDKFLLCSDLSYFHVIGDNTIGHFVTPFHFLSEEGLLVRAAQQSMTQIAELVLANFGHT
jgi:hypothetical protein